MMDTEQSFLPILKSIRESLLTILFFLYPIFFLITTQEFYNLNKFYLLAGVVLIYLAILTFEFITIKKITWKSLSFQKSIIFFLLAYAASVVFSSPNKVEALLDPRAGIGVFLALSVLYTILSQHAKKASYLKLLFIGSIILSILNILFFLDPFKNISLPPTFQFLKTSAFTPAGSLLDLALFLGFFAILTIVNILTAKKDKLYGGSIDPSQAFGLSVIMISLFLTLYSLLTPLTKGGLQPLLPPASYSWYTSVETLKQPKSAIFGVGPGNFVSAFTRAKNPSYNQAPFWNLNFTVGRSFILQIWAETGILGLLAFGLLIFLLVIRIRNSPPATKFPVLYLIIIFLFFPVSQPALFLFFTTLAFVEDQASEEGEQKVKHINLSDSIPILLGVATFSILLIGFATYLLGRSVLAEYNFKKSVDAISSNNAGPVYETLRRSIQLNPYIERFRASFANINIVVANNIAAKGADKLTDQDRQNITQAVQVAISESKAAVALNSEKSVNWENLAIIYRNIINTAQGADGWAIASYQRAIVADPVNPGLRLNLGGVYYSLGNYDDAKTMFEQAVNLKPDWANAHYNLAWTYFQKKEYKKAVEEMQASLNLIDPKSDDYKKGQKELEDFKKNLSEEAAPDEEEKPKAEELTLPSPAPEITPLIKLPEEASPEAR